MVAIAGGAAIAKGRPTRGRSIPRGDLRRARSPRRLSSAIPARQDGTGRRPGSGLSPCACRQSSATRCKRPPSRPCSQASSHGRTGRMVSIERCGRRARGDSGAADACRSSAIPPAGSRRSGSRGRRSGHRAGALRRESLAGEPPARDVSVRRPRPEHEGIGRVQETRCWRRPRFRSRRPRGCRAVPARAAPGTLRPPAEC